MTDTDCTETRCASCGAGMTHGDYSEPGAGWVCRYGHPTTPPITYDGTEWRLCPTCEKVGYVTRRIDGWGVITSTDVEIVPDPAIVMRALAEAVERLDGQQPR